jgi:hypothetical protein
MNSSKSRFILSSMLLGAVLGLGIGVVVAESKKEQLKLAALAGGDKAAPQPGLKEWMAVAVSGVTLLRQLAAVLMPKA